MLALGILQPLLKPAQTGSSFKTQLLTSFLLELKLRLLKMLNKQLVISQPLLLWFIAC